MSEITLKNLRHSSLQAPQNEADWALKHIDVKWSDGGAYALLGPSGCGKTTLLNIISGLITPSEGRVFFGEEDVTQVPTEQRNIAQVFQFPVVYDTMTVYDNLAFPLRNRGAGASEIDAQVREIAKMLDLEAMLPQRAAGLTADGKQKISLGRGLVRAGVSAILFDEPLTVIDPHLKWVLRSKLKELHQEVGSTMIYVTHDQTEALTFADQVVVMHEGTVVQIGTPVELFEKPRHTFVGHFIGSPGMNVLPCQIESGAAIVAGHQIELAGKIAEPPPGSRLEIGIRPEFISFAGEGLPVEIVKVSDAGRHSIVETRLDGARIMLLVNDGEAVPSEAPHLKFDPDHTQVYADGWMIA
jgi:glycerol transport system ATP-binding protein